MKNTVLSLFILCFVFSSNAQDVYDDALTAASYAYAHSKKAHKSNNVFHTQEYADKAIEAFEKVEALAEQCNCKVANETAYQAKTDMESSLNQDTYERSRFFAKRAKDLGAQLLEELTLCQVNKGNIIAESESELVKKEELLAETAKEVSARQKELEAKRLQLELEQKELNRKIAEQNKKRKELESERIAELKKQSLVKEKAEKALQKLESALRELGAVLDEESKFESQIGFYTRTEQELKNESLDQTKTFYVNRAKEIAQIAIQQFADYTMVEN